MERRPTIYTMMREAVERLGGSAAYSDIRDYIRQTYGNVNESSINAPIILCSVNIPSRVQCPQNQKARMANDSRYDFLSNTGRGFVETYDPRKHGVWEIRNGVGDRWVAARASVGNRDNSPPADPEPEPEVEEALAPDEPPPALLFPVESQLRDFLARNIRTIKVNNRSLRLYADELGHNGVEYPTDVGFIDILAVDDGGNFVVFELKLSRGPDYAIGQIARYMGWVKHNLARGKSVSGVIVSHVADEKLKYAASILPQVTLL